MGARSQVAAAHRRVPTGDDFLKIVRALEVDLMPRAEELQRLLEKRWKKREEMQAILRVALADGVLEWLYMERKLSAPPEASHG